MVVPLILYGVPCWYPKIENQKMSENIQKKYIKWIQKVYSSINYYKNYLLNTQFLPISLILQLQALLFLSKSMNGVFEFEWEGYLKVKQPTLQ